MSLGSRKRSRRSCSACMAQIDGRALRCRWCGATVCSPKLAGAPRPLGLGLGNALGGKAQAFRHWDEKRSTIEIAVDTSRSHDSVVVHATGGQPSESPSRTTGTPSTTK